jgi:hypothetical protein
VGCLVVLRCHLVVLLWFPLLQCVLPFPLELFLGFLSKLLFLITISGGQRSSLFFGWMRLLGLLDLLIW